MGSQLLKDCIRTIHPNASERKRPRNKTGFLNVFIIGGGMEGRIGVILG
jgi:hypothetical protein